MPIYEYRCDKCKRKIELFQKISDPPAEKCECGGKLRKLISNSSFILKGTGWFKTDYKNKKEPSKKPKGESI